MHQRHNPWRAVLVAIQASLVLMTATSALAQKLPPKDWELVEIQSLVNTNEKMQISPYLCRTLGFVHGTARLTPASLQALPRIRDEWRKAPSDKNDVVLLVLPDMGLQAREAARQAQARAATLRAALVKAGIPQSDVFVLPASPKTQGMGVSCPPVATAD